MIRNIIAISPIKSTRNYDNNDNMDSKKSNIKTESKLEFQKILDECIKNQNN